MFDIEPMVGQGLLSSLLVDEAILVVLRSVAAFSIVAVDVAAVVVVVVISADAVVAVAVDVVDVADIVDVVVVVGVVDVVVVGFVVVGGGSGSVSVVFGGNIDNIALWT